jgi:hypothetical protein
MPASVETSSWTRLKLAVEHAFERVADDRMVAADGNTPNPLEQVKILHCRQITLPAADPVIADGSRHEPSARSCVWNGGETFTFALSEHRGRS